MDILTESIDIPVYKKSYLESKIAKLNRKAVKMGCEPMVLTYDNEHTIEYNRHPITDHRLLTPIILEMVTVTLTYKIPMIEGYELIARLDIFPAENENVVLVKPVPDKEVPAKYLNATSIGCDHCGHNRYRNHSIVLRDIQTNEYIEVGSTCVKDFFGHDPKGFMFMASIKFANLIDSIDDEKIYSGSYRSIESYSLDRVLAITNACIIKWGFFSKSKINELEEQGIFIHESTSSHVWDNINPNPKMDKARLIDIQNEDMEMANRTIEYFKTLDPENNDYLTNCCKIAKMGNVPWKYMGYACSMITAYQKAMGKIEERKKEESKPQSQHIGQIGERLRNIKVIVTYKRYIETDFGTSTLYAFKDENSNVYKTFYSGSSWECEIEDCILLTGTVKKHAKFNGKNETMLNRVSVAQASKDIFSKNEFKIS